MVFPDRLNTNVLIRIGLVFLILASLWKLFLHPSGNLSADLIDRGTGLLYGVSFGCLLLGLKRNGRGRSTTGGGLCA